VALIDQQLLVGGAEQEKAIEKQSSSGPITAPARLPYLTSGVATPSS
jgi:hypothetical protein